MTTRNRKARRTYATHQFHINYEYKNDFTLEEAQALTYEMILRGLEYEKEILRLRKRRDLYIKDY